MNKHIELVKKWQAGEAISLKELGANAEAAYVAYAAAVRAARAAAAACAADAADATYAVRRVDYFVKRYEELIERFNK
tara:strand:+ start:577 stop:810 length:234 start_codon:yes stop_codon:yes gene_type:complete